MTSEVAKMVATASIWLSVAIILAGGLYRMSGGEAAFFIAVTFIVICGATLSTCVIWIAGARQKKESRGFEVVRPVEVIAKEGSVG